jgi:hypothetical protein
MFLNSARHVQLLGYADSDYLRQSGMVIDDRLIGVKGRVLPPPAIQWGGNTRPDVVVFLMRLSHA